MRSFIKPYINLRGNSINIWCLDACGEAQQKTDSQQKYLKICLLLFFSFENINLDMLPFEYGFSFDHQFYKSCEL